MVDKWFGWNWYYEEGEFIKFKVRDKCGSGEGKVDGINIVKSKFKGLGFRCEFLGVIRIVGWGVIYFRLKVGVLNIK